MPTYYPPGRRKGNRWYVVRGRIDGEPYEKVAKGCTNKSDAEDYWFWFKRTVRESNHAARQPKTFAQVADLYMDTRGIRLAERRFIDKLKGEIGHLPIADVTLEHIATAANALYPRGRNETKNRQAYTPAAAILHFAHDCELRDYIVVKKLKEREPETRRPTPGVYGVLIANTKGQQRAFIAFIFAQGWRITETLHLDWKNVDLANRKLRLYVGKAGRWKTVEMHDEAFTVLANMPGNRKGRVFTWGNRHNVYRWLRPLCERLEVTFTPHMARHDFAGDLRESGSTTRDLLDVGTWTSAKSVARYDFADQDHARKVLKRRSLRGKKRGKSRK